MRIIEHSGFAGAAGSQPITYSRAGIVRPATGMDDGVGGSVESDPGGLGRVEQSR